MSKGNQTENDIITLLARGTVPGWNAGANLFWALHTADPGEAGAQNTSEATYTGYARVAVSRDVAGLTIAANQMSNAALTQFGICTAGSETLTHCTLGTASSGAGQILYSGALSVSLAVSAPIQPQFAIGALTVTED
jgi:hypothetical protein